MKKISIEELAKLNKIPDWEVEGILAYNGLAKGKSVSPASFQSFVKKFRERAQGAKLIEKEVVIG